MSNAIRFVRIPNKYAVAVAVRVNTPQGPGYFGFCLGFPGDKQTAVDAVQAAILG